MFNEYKISLTPIQVTFYQHKSKKDSTEDSVFAGPWNIGWFLSCMGEES